MTDVLEGGSDTDGASSQSSKIYRVTLQVLSIPVLILGVVHVIKKWYGIQLIPVGEDLLENYRMVVHFSVDFLVFYPVLYLNVIIHPIFKDLITISICLSTINWRAFSLVDSGDGESTVLSRVWESFGYLGNAATIVWLSQGLMSKLLGLLDLIIVFVETIIYLLAWPLAAVAFLITRWEGLAAKIFDTLYVLLRGMSLVGLYLPIRHAINLVRSGGLVEVDQALARWMRQAAAAFFSYLTAVGLAVLIFFGSLGVGGTLPVFR